MASKPICCGCESTIAHVPGFSIFQFREEQHFCNFVCFKKWNQLNDIKKKTTENEINTSSDDERSLS